jgi:hypothetical protein
MRNVLILGLVMALGLAGAATARGHRSGFHAPHARHARATHARAHGFHMPRPRRPRR